jgi:antitoxin component YwqK of YwqJK toxin-antitoxin module
MKGLTMQRTAVGCLALALAAAWTSLAAAQQRTNTRPQQGQLRSQLVQPRTTQPSQPRTLLSDTEENTYDDIHGSAITADGEIETVRERYPDGKIRIERQVTMDPTGNYVNHGTWKMLTPSGAVSAEGQYYMGQRVGLWTRWHGRNETPVFNEFPFERFKAPFMSQATFADGQMDGEWLITDSSERKVMQISLKGGKRNGPAITWLPTGKTYRQATYDNGVPVGDVLEASTKTGELVRADSYIDGRKVVTKTTYYSTRDKKKTETIYLASTTTEQTPDDYWNFRLATYRTDGKDLKHGSSKAWYSSGKPQMDGFYQYDTRAGTFTFWHENGQVAATGEYKDDRAEGIWVWWHANGQKSAVGKYQSGALIGEWRWWNEDGRLTKQHEYDGSEAITSQDDESYDIGRTPDEADDTTVK